jgi:hypothetical protein
MIAGVTGDYSGYFTTGREYDRQHYEGASTVWGRCTGDWLIEEVRDLEAGRVAPPAPEAYFEADGEYSAAPSVPGRATRPTLRFEDGELHATWSSPAGVLPAFGPDPWIVLEELSGDQWAPLILGGVQVSDQTRAMFVERGLEGMRAIWAARYSLPAMFKGRTLRVRLMAADFVLKGDEAVSGGVRVD